MFALPVFISGCFGGLPLETPLEPPTEPPTATDSNLPPKAYIDSISPSEALAGELISFDGHGTDIDGTVVAYRWRSSIDDALSSKASFGTSELSVGEHIIYFRVQDNNDAWSEEVESKLVINASEVIPTGQITNAAISWGTSPDRVIFTWSVSNLNPSFEYWVYPHVGFTENTGPFGSTPEDEASDLEGMYEMAVTHFRPALDGTGAWNWYGGKPSNPFGKLALLAYDPVTHKAYVAAVSEPINTSAW